MYSIRWINLYNIVIHLSCNIHSVNLLYVFGTVAVARKSVASVYFALLGVGDVHKFRTTALQKIHPFWSKEGKLQIYTFFVVMGA
jgi:hypothetical protein